MSGALTASAWALIEADALWLVGYGKCGILDAMLGSDCANAENTDLHNWDSIPFLRLRLKSSFRAPYSLSLSPAPDVLDSRNCGFCIDDPELNLLVFDQLKIHKRNGELRFERWAYN